MEDFIQLKIYMLCKFTLILNCNPPCTRKYPPYLNIHRRKLGNKVKLHVLLDVI